MAKLNEIIEWQEFGSELRLYVKHYRGPDEKLNIQIVFEDATHEKVTEINIPSHKVIAFLTAINGNLLSKKYEINVTPQE